MCSNCLQKCELFNEIEEYVKKDQCVLIHKYNLSYVDRYSNKKTLCVKSKSGKDYVVLVNSNTPVSIKNIIFLVEIFDIGIEEGMLLYRTWLLL